MLKRSFYLAMMIEAGNDARQSRKERWLLRLTKQHRSGDELRSSTDAGELDTGLLVSITENWWKSLVEYMQYSRGRMLVIADVFTLSYSRRFSQLNVD